MSRKKIKFILLITGLIFIAAFAVTLNLSSGFLGLNGSLFPPGFILSLVGLIPLIIVSLMHSKDIRETKRGLSNLLKGLAYFWIITGSLNAAALIIINIFFIR